MNFRLKTTFTTGLILVGLVLPGCGRLHSDFQKTQPTQNAKTPPAAAIASAHPLATRAGMEILNQGGNDQGGSRRGIKGSGDQGVSQLDLSISGFSGHLQNKWGVRPSKVDEPRGPNQGVSQLDLS